MHQVKGLCKIQLYAQILLITTGTPSEEKISLTLFDKVLSDLFSPRNISGEDLVMELLSLKEVEVSYNKRSKVNVSYVAAPLCGYC